VSDQFLSLGEIAQFINGAAFKPEDWGSEGLPIIRIQNLTDPTKSFNRTTRSIAPKLHVQPGDLLVSWSATLGVFVWERPEIALLNQHIFRVLPDENLVDKTYLRHALSGALLAMQKHLHGATMQHVNRGEFLATPVFLPPLPEQRRIAAILDQADTLRTQRRAALAQLDSLTQSLFLDMFGDPVTNPNGWALVRLDQLIRPDDTINYGVVQPGDALDEGVPLVRVGDIVDGNLSAQTLKRIDLKIESAYRRSRLKGDEVLVTCVGSIGVVALVDPSMKGFNIARAVARIPLADQVDREFIASYLRTDFVQRYFTAELRTVSQPTLNIKQICETKVITPPLPLQQTFATRVQAIEALKAQHRAALATQDALFASLQQRAFAGAL
jgi:type I restriction enzyme S subunit